MSKDIRSYFRVQTSKNVESMVTKRGKDPETIKRKKKKQLTIDSESDEEGPCRKLKTSPDKPSCSKQSKDEKPKGKTCKEDSKSLSCSHLSEFFGRVPVQQTERISSSKCLEISEDPDVLKALQDVAESEWDLTSLPEENGGCGIKDTNINAMKNLTPSSLEGSCKGDVKNVAVSDNQPTHSTPNSSDKLFTKLAKHESPVRYSPPSKKQKVSTSENELRSSPPHIVTSQPIDVSAKKSIKEETKHDRYQIHYSESAPVSHLWVDKYKPTALKQIIGQQGEKSNVKKLLKWLSAWYSHHGPGVNKKLKRPGPWEKDDSGSYYKAALLSGPPGVGKTTTAHLVCKELGMDVVEFNASDTRSKKLMNQEVTELLSCKTLFPFFQGGQGSKTTDKHVLVMDEVDGMAGNEDRGGVQELISLIKNSKCPVICMCNDRNHPKIRSLANYCFDLRFYKPRLEQIKGAMMSVCFKEKVQISADALNEVIAATNCDIRQVLHNLSMWSATDKRMNTEKTKTDAHSAKKHIKLGPWDSVRCIFSAEDNSKASLNEKSDLFFNDYNIMPLFVQENYLIVSPNAAKKSSQTLRQLARTATSLSYGDLIEKTVRSRNDAWSLLPVQAIYACVVPGFLMEGRITAQIQFPSWLGKNSTYGKMNRQLQELQSHMRLSISGGKQALNLDYIPNLQTALVKPLEQNGAEGVSETLKIIQDYHLTLSDLESLFELSQWPGQSHPMSKVESKVKAALTRTYNKSGIMTPYSIESRVSKRKGTSATLEEDGLPEEDNELQESDSDSDNANDAMIKVKKQAVSKTIASSSRGSGRGSRGNRGNVSQGSVSGGRGRGRGTGKK